MEHHSVAVLWCLFCVYGTPLCSCQKTVTEISKNPTIFIFVFEAPDKIKWYSYSLVESLWTGCCWYIWHFFLAESQIVYILHCMVLIYNLHLFRIYGSDRYDIKKKYSSLEKFSSKRCMFVQCTCMCKRYLFVNCTCTPMPCFLLIETNFKIQEMKASVKLASLLDIDKEILETSYHASI